MITMNIPNGTGYRVVNPFKAADRDALNAARTVTVTVFGADKAGILTEGAAKLAHFAYAFGGWRVTTSEVTDGEEFSVTVSNLAPGAAFYVGIILTRLVGRQQGIIKADALTVYTRRSEIRRQFERQFCPSVVSYGSRVANGPEAAKMGSGGYVDYIDPLFNLYGLYQHGSIAASLLPA